MVYLGRVVCAIVVVVSKSGFSAGEIGWSYACTAIARSCRQFWLAPSLTAFSRRRNAGGIDVRRRAADVFRCATDPFAGFFPLLLAYSLTYMPTIR